MSGENIDIVFGFDASAMVNKIRTEAFDIIEDEMLKAVADLQRNSPVGASKADGKPSLAESWDIDTIRDSSGEIIVNVTNNAFPALQRLEGRKAGRQPPIEALIPWVELKLQVKGKKAKSVAFLIARKIGKQGTFRSKRNFKEFNPETGEAAPNGAILRAVARIKRRLNSVKVLT